jgi:serine/threonine-protein kinase
MVAPPAAPLSGSRGPDESQSPAFSRRLIPIAALGFLAVSFQLVAQPELATVYRDPLILLVTLTAVLLALGIYALQRFGLAFPSTLLRLGNVFAIAVALAIALVETAMPLWTDRPVLGISAVGPWILLNCVLVRNRPIWTLATALLAASMWPLAYVVNVLRHDYALVAWGRLIVWPGVNYLMAVLGCLIARNLQSMGAAPPTSGDLGRYRLLTPIGAGGMGEVWKASHEMLARQAAIKLVRPLTPASSRRQADLWVERFRREANVIASLQSPHTIYLYDFGVSQSGQFYYVMELLDGISLQTLITSYGPQPPSRVRAILRQICLSLDEAHGLGLVHRDLKPSNVMLCKLALTYDFVKVLDFGLAKCAACEDLTQLTLDGTTAGTPAYMAPEVALGETRVDGRVDIYAMGCIAYFLLTGSLVFDDPNPMAMALKHVQATPVPPSARTELPVPADLERIVLRCIEKKPDDRPASVREVAKLLDACELPPWTEEVAAAWWDHHMPATVSLRSLPLDADGIERG